jgi:WD40 repeat protein/predicted Ser/Thr protein kinase
MIAGKICPTCQSELTGEAVDGLCLKCLGRLAFFSESAGLLRLGDYELLEEIARGGMGVVYRARQMSLNRIVALKVMLQGPFSSRDFVQRFQQEAHAVAALRHPNIVTVYEVGEQEGSHFLALEFVEGVNLAELVRERPLPARRAAGYLQIIAQAVEHAHQRGVLHRDLKPSNILLDVFDQPRVTDFGLAKLASQDTALTVTGQVLGSPNYMPPEQAAGKFAKTTPASDVYSLGAILYELLTSRPPFHGETLQAVLAQVQETEPVPPRHLIPGIPVDLQTICLKCLQKDPERRYPTAVALAEDLGRFLDHQPIRARPVPVMERVWLWSRRRPLLAALSGALFLAVVVGVAGILWEWRQAEWHARGEEQQRKIAEQDAAETRLDLYAADVAVAAQAILDGHPGAARRTLARLRPLSGARDLRGFEWYYLWHRSEGDQLVTLKGHQLTVDCVAFSRDGQRLATGSQDGTLRIWNASAYTLLKTLKITTNAVWSVAFTPDDQGLVTSCNECAQLWDTRSWECLRTFPGELAAVARSGTRLATSESNPFFYETAGAVRLFDWSTGALLATFGAPGRALALSSDGGRLAVAGPASGITIYDTPTRQIVRQWPTKNPVWSLVFSPDDRQLLSTGWSTAAALWTLAGAGPPQLLTGHQLNVWSAVFSPDGATIATTSSDQSIRFWDTATLAQKFWLHGHASEVWCAAYSPDGRRLATGGKDQNVMLWPTVEPQQQGELPHYNVDSQPVFSPDGSRLVTVQTDLTNAQLWQVSGRQLLATNLAAGRFVLGFSRDSQEVLTFDSSRFILNYWPPNGSEPAREITLHDAEIQPGTSPMEGLSPDQHFFFVIDATGLIQIWNTDTGRRVSRVHGPLPPIRNAVLSPSGRQIVVSVERDHVAHLYDCATGAELVLAGHRDFVSGLAFSPDGATLATGSMDGTIRLWNATNGQTTATLPGHLTEATDVAFSPDGRTLASLGRRDSLKLWHLPTLREVYSENLPQAGQWLRFSADGRQLAVETGNDSIRLLPAPPD